MTESLTPDQIFIRKLTNIVLANLVNSSFGVSELARESGMSIYSLNRRLNSILRKTGNQFINEVRLQKAREMLNTESLTVKEIAFRVGFSSAAYFSLCFSEFFGYPPGKIRKESFPGLNANNQPKGAINLKQKNSLSKILTFHIPWILFICDFVAIAFLIIFYFQNTRHSEAISKLEKSVAVLPFKNDSPDTETTYFVNGIMEKVLNNLQIVRQLRVISRTSVEQYRNSTKPIPVIAREQGVNYIVEGSGQKSGNTFSISVQLIKASSENHLWGKAFEREIKEASDIFNVQNEIAQSIAEALEASITPEEKQLINNMPTTNLTAYDFYQRGREELSKFWINDRNKAALQKAGDFFNKALKYDSTFAQAYSGLAGVYWGKHWNVKEYFSENFMDSVPILVNKALSYNSQLSEAYTYMGLFYYYLSKPEQSNEQFDKAIKLNPNDWLAYSKKGELYLANDDFFNTISYLQKAASLNRGTELPYIMGNIGYTYFNYGFPEKARQYYEDKLKLDCDTLSYYSALADNEFWQSNFNKSIEYGNKGFSMDSTHVGIIITLGRDYEMLGQAKVSLKYFSKWLDIRRTTGVLTSFPADIGYVFRLNGNKKEADDFNDDMIKSYNKVLQLKREGEQAYYSYYNLAKAYALKGEKDIACENLKIFSQIHQCPLWLEMEMKMDPVFDCIREESDFKNIANDIEAKYQAKHERVKNWLIEHKML